MPTSESELSHSDSYLERVQIHGYFQGMSTAKLNGNINGKREDDYLQKIIQEIAAKHKVPFKPKKIVAQGNAIAIVDHFDVGWLVIQSLHRAINISQLLKRKIKQIFLNKGYLIATTRKGHILLQWCSQKLFSQETASQIKIYPPTNLAHFFEAFSLRSSIEGDFFCLASELKYSQTTALQIRNNSIIIHPLRENVMIQNKIIGVSVAKNYCLCWDSQGKLYAWGCLTFLHCFGTCDESISKPTHLTQLKTFIVSAHAASNYCLALDSQGKIYQWGIKQLKQVVNEPQQVNFSTENGTNTFICLKGKADCFAALSLLGQLYVWGPAAAQFIDKIPEFPNDWREDVYRPVKIRCLDEQRIIDYDIGQGYIVTIVNNKINGVASTYEKKYWNNFKIQIDKKWHPNRYINKVLPNTGKEQAIKLTFEEKLNSCSNEKILSFRTTNYKQIYLQSAAEEEQIFNFLMKKNDFKASQQRDQENQQWDSTTINLKKKLKKLNNIKTQGNQRKKMTKQMIMQIVKTFNCSSRPPLRFSSIRTHTLGSHFRNPSQSGALISARQLRTDIKNHRKTKRPREDQNDISERCPSSIARYSQRLSQDHKNLEPYDQRAKKIRQKKQEIESEQMRNTLMKVHQNSYEYRQRLKEEKQINDRKQQSKEILKNSLVKHLVKHFVIKVLTAPLGEGRNVKIDNFARKLKVDRLERNIRGLFVKTRIRFSFQKLQTIDIAKANKLVMVFRNYVQRFRKRRFALKRQYAISEIMKQILRENIRIGLKNPILYTRKLQKFQSWLVMVKEERRKCLKQLWLSHLLRFMKPNLQLQSSVTLSFQKCSDQVTFQQLYEQKVLMNPNLKLKNFLKNHYVFRLRGNYFQKNTRTLPITTLEETEQKPSKDKKRTKIKFVSVEEGADKVSPNLLEILPYSSHYNKLTKPKNYDIPLPELLKVNDKWIDKQRRILSQQIDGIIFEHECRYRKQVRQYQTELAQYIRRKYDNLCEVKWRYIIEFNKTKRTRSKEKKEKKLRRLLGIIGMTRLLDEDCIPEKHVILDEAMKRADAPQAPNNYIVFGKDEFKKNFKNYFELVAKLAKQMRRQVMGSIGIP